MLRIPGMPLLPGTTFPDLARTRYNRTQTLLNHRGLSMLNDRQPPTLVNPNGMIIDPNCPPTGIPALYPPQVGPVLPAWLQYNKQCLCFYAYFKETLQEVYHAPYQVRKVKIYHYLEDGTTQIVEPKVKNSGLSQGCLVHRQRIPKQRPCESDFISIMDLNVDTTIQIFDRVYHIYNCDLFTRRFLNRSGIPVPDPVKEPLDPTTELRKAPAGRVSFLPPKTRTFPQFLKFDGQILRFYGYWDDRTEFGDVRNMEICYYLADDTIDIKEKRERNSGREGPTLFLKRAKLPREYILQMPGVQYRPNPLLNVMEAYTLRGRPYFTADSIDNGKPILCYKDKDLQIGTVLNVYGRSVVITSCDDYTKEYYRTKYGIEDFTPAPRPPGTEDCVQMRSADRRLPPHNGWGSYEDSVGNCRSMTPKRPPTNLRKFIKFDRKVLRFGASLLSSDVSISKRYFVISFYLSDDTIRVYEIVERNSGYLGGEVMKRARIPLPGQESNTSNPPKYYQASDFFVGSIVCLRDQVYGITTADEYSLVYMESHPSQFPTSDIKLIMDKLREAIRPNYRNFIAKCLPEEGTNERDMRSVRYDTFKQAVIDAMNGEIEEHEIITLCRHYSCEQQPPITCNRNVVRAAAHLELKRALWHGVEGLKEHLFHINPSKKPFLPATKIRSTLKACRLPFSLELINDIMAVLNRNECDEIEVSDLLNFLDANNDNPPNIRPVNIAFELCPDLPFLHKGRLVNFTCFLQALGLASNEEEDARPETPANRVNE